MENVRISLITTILNEEHSIDSFLSSIFNQTRMPDEIVIVDAKSTDDTVNKIKNYTKTAKNIPIKLYVFPGNRSIGRNEAIKHCSHQFIAVTDAGCNLKKDWLEELIKPFDQDESIDVVAGWYQPIVHTDFQKALSKVLNFKSENINANTFLPSTRSLAFKKSIFYKAGGFDEQYSHNEDTPFALKLKKIGAKFLFQPKALVYWITPNSYNNLYRTIWRYAYGDGEAKLWLSQYKIIFSFWILLTIIFILFIYLHNLLYLEIFLLIFFSYLYLPFFQSGKINGIRELLTIPLLKFTMILANTSGFINGLRNKNEI